MVDSNQNGLSTNHSCGSVRQIAQGPQTVLHQSKTLMWQMQSQCLHASCAQTTDSSVTSCSYSNNNKLCVRPPQYAPAPASWPFDLESGVRVTCDVAYLCANFSLPRPLCSRLRPNVRDRQMSSSSDVTHASLLNASALSGLRHNNRTAIAPYGTSSKFRGTGSRLDQCSVKAWVNRKF